jgi:splicing factor 3B subunit 2
MYNHFYDFSLATPSGISTTVSAGLETPDMIELRKRRTQIESDMESIDGETPTLFKILPEKATSVGGSMMGSSKVYDLSAAASGKKGDGSISTGIDMALNPDELELDSELLQSRYNAQLKNNNNDNDDHEDMSDIVADHLSKQNKKMKKKQQQQQQQASTPVGNQSEKEKNKKYKEFKF